jgi:hypothetical protein
MRLEVSDIACGVSRGEAGSYQLGLNTQGYNPGCFVAAEVSQKGRIRERSIDLS